MAAHKTDPPPPAKFIQIAAVQGRPTFANPIRIYALDIHGHVWVRVGDMDSDEVWTMIPPEREGD